MTTLTSPPAAKQPAADAIRLQLDPRSSDTAVLDGAWWPRSRELADELPALVHALAGKRGTITHAMLNVDDWELPHPRRIPAAEGPVRLGWYTSQPSGLLTLICDFGRERFDLFVVPVDASAPSAAAAMDAAADSDDARRAPELLALVERQA
jgi:Family of unknown function (DUF5994)